MLWILSGYLLADIHKLERHQCVSIPMVLLKSFLDEEFAKIKSGDVVQLTNAEIHNRSSSFSDYSSKLCAAAV